MGFGMFLCRVLLFFPTVTETEYHVEVLDTESAAITNLRLA
jgi:hypothetical protein